MLTAPSREIRVLFPQPHPKQRGFIDSTAKRKIIKAGRRGGKTVGVSVLAGQEFLKGKRVLYATPTSDQIGRFWSEVTRAFAEPIKRGLLKKNETEHVIEFPGKEQRIRAKTAWNADTLRGDYADVLILDEWQLMNEDAWGIVGAPMLLDNDGDAVFVFTPPSIRSRSVSKADDPRHAEKMYQKALKDTTGRWAAYHFTSHDNPHLSRKALEEITQDMTALAIRQEILAEEVRDLEGSLWKRDKIEDLRVQTSPQLVRIVVAIDPSATGGPDSDEAGIVIAGLGADGHGYVLEDRSLRATPDGWARVAVVAYHKHTADRIVAEANNGGDMVELTVRTVDKNVSYRKVNASRGKITRAEPIAALYEQGRVHHVGAFPELEDEMCTWMPGDASPNRMDALVWALTELMLGNAEPKVSFL